MRDIIRETVSFGEGRDGESGKGVVFIILD